MSTREVRRTNRTNHCPFPDFKCSGGNGKPSCPFYQLRYAYDDDGKRVMGNKGALYYECVWQTEIKPAYEKERKGKKVGVPTDKIYMVYCDTCKMVTRHFNGECIKCNYEELDEDCYDPEN